MPVDQSAPAEAATEERLRGELVKRALAMQPVSIVGNALTWFVAATVTFREPDRLRWLTWVLLQALASACVVSIYTAASTARGHRLRNLARWMLRLTPLATGMVWAVGAAYWPAQSGDTGLCMLLSISGLTAAASSTFAAAPRGFLLFSIPALLPYAVPGDGLWWLGLLVSFFLAATTAVCFGNHRLLSTTLRLRWDNEQLLRNAIEERETAQTLQERAERAAQSKTRFLAAASHDLRQPVQALALFADLLNGDLQETKRVEVTAALTRTAQALSTMLEGLLDLSRLDAGVTANVLQPVAVQPLLYDAAASLIDEAEALNVRLSVAAVDCDVLVDPVLLARVVHNLAANAVRHGGRERAVLLSARRRGRTHCLLQVWDRGNGIESADREAIFEEFVQLDNPERTQHKGLGLGLSMVQRICKLSQWPLTLDSRPGRGSVFTVQLPLAAARSRSSHDLRAHDSATLQVMLVEDDAVVRDALASWLTERGCHVHAVEDAGKALEQFDRAHRYGSRIDVLVSDHSLPGPMAGADLVHTLRSRDHDLPTVILTGGIDAPLGEHPPARTTVLRKPVSGRVLWAAIQHVMQAPDATRPPTLPE